MLCLRSKNRLSSVVWIVNPAAVEQVCLTSFRTDIKCKPFLIQTQKDSMVPISAFFINMLLLFVNQKIFNLLVASEVIKK